MTFFSILFFVVTAVVMIAIVSRGFRIQRQVHDVFDQAARLSQDKIRQERDDLREKEERRSSAEDVMRCSGCGAEGTGGQECEYCGARVV